MQGMAHVAEHLDAAFAQAGIADRIGNPLHGEGGPRDHHVIAQRPEIGRQRLIGQAHLVHDVVDEARIEQLVALDHVEHVRCAR
jgi:hypothetical protein